MKIAILVPSIGGFGKRGFYNAQEIGIAKQFGAFFETVIIYRAVPIKEKEQLEHIDGYENIIICKLPSRNLGSNGIINVEMLDDTIDVLIFFSDTQLCVPSIYRWAKYNNVKLYPYIGVTESHNTNYIIKKILNFVFRRNTGVYKKLCCFAKTPEVRKSLCACGINNTIVAPVGLDISLLNSNYNNVNKTSVKVKYGYKEVEKIILFVGRLVYEKQPERMINIFKSVLDKDNLYRLIMVGNGELRNLIEDKIKNLNLQSKIRILAEVPNDEMWELYRMADTFVNLNQQEIFGMALLEAMYYGCKVVAWQAPGPSYIIENEKTGYLVQSDDEVISKVLKRADFEKDAHERIISDFTWKKTAQIMLDIIQGE